MGRLQDVALLQSYVDVQGLQQAESVTLDM